MSVEAFSALPLQAGQAVAATAGRTAMWLIRAYMRAPLRNTALTALVTMSALAGSNALYNQSGQHPAPMFGSFSARTPVEATSAPVMPAERPAQLLAPAAETTASIPTATTPEPTRPLGNEDVFEVQRKLTAFEVFGGKVDGIYGPQTARAIKAFEEKIGRKPTGELTPEIIKIIRETPIIAEPAPIAETTSNTGVTSLTMTSPPAPLEPTGPATRTVQTMVIQAPPAAPAAPAEPAAPVEAAAPEPEPEKIAVMTTPIDVTRAATDPKVVSAVQRGLASLGFLHGAIDGVPGEATAKAVRNFEVYYNYNVTGRITPELINLLVQNGAVI